ncbi:MAG: GntR family transcriptional regulator [Alphaproteobacteria bacterium]|nr:GntR family transcriptional regulator [Alphaproteobacteria bacterium]
MTTPQFTFPPPASACSRKTRAYIALKDAILRMDIYASPEPLMLDERALSERLGISRTPVREAIAMLEQDGFVKILPRRGIMIVRRSNDEIVDMVRAWAALESMAARLVTTTAPQESIAALRQCFAGFGKDHRPEDHIEEYYDANIAFHRGLTTLSRSKALVDLTDKLLPHLRGCHQLTLGDRVAASLPEHLAIIDALEARDTELAEKRSRDHTLGLASFVATHGREVFN